MIVDFTNPQSIRAWLSIHPKHKDQMRGLWKLWPAFRAQMMEALR